MFKFPGLHYGKYSPSDKNGSGTGRSDLRGRRLVIAALIFAVALGSDLVWVVGEEALSTLAELVEEGIERFYTRVFGLTTYRAQMASAYTYLTVAGVFGIWLVRRALIALRRVRHTGYLWWCAFSAAARQTWLERVEGFLAWWQVQDWLNKAAVIVGVLVVIIPVVLTLSLALGSAIADLL